jgi:hypothetical protein
MSVTEFNIEKAASLVIKGINAGHPWSVLFTQYQDAAKTIPEDFTGTYTAVICSDAAMTKKLFTLTEGSGLTKSANTLQISRTKTQNKLKTGTYYMQVHEDIDADNSQPIFKIVLQVKASR